MLARSMVFALAASASLVACGGGPTPAPTPSVSARPCALADEDSSFTKWQQIAPTGYTFCVPANYTLVRSEARASSANLKWGEGRPPEEQGFGRATVGQHVGETPDQSIANSMQVQQWTEMIDGHDVQITVTSARGEDYVTTAQFAVPRIWIRGHAQNAGAQAEQIVVIRSVRFSN